MALTAVPAAAVGLVAQDAVERRLGRPGPTAALLAGAGLAMWAADRRPQTRSVGPREAAAAALAQVVALAPGVSRAGATMTALRAAGVHREEAATFSMLMSLPITAGAAGLTLLRSGAAPPPPVLVGAPVAALAAATVAGRARASRRLLSGAALYRLAVAAAVVVRLPRKVLT